MNLRGAFLLAGITTLLSFLLLFAANRFVLRKQLRLPTMVLWSVFVAYLVVLFYLTLSRVADEERVWQWNLLAGLEDLVKRRDFHSPCFNILLFVPWGVLGAVLFPASAGKTVGAGVCLSLLIECMQYLFLRGVADTVDLVCNSLGTAIGVAIVCIWQKWRQKSEPTQTHV